MSCEGILRKQSGSSVHHGTLYPGSQQPMSLSLLESHQFSDITQWIVNPFGFYNLGVWELLSVGWKDSIEVNRHEECSKVSFFIYSYINNLSNLLCFWMFIIWSDFSILLILTVIYVVLFATESLYRRGLHHNLCKHWLVNHVIVTWNVFFKDNWT